MTVLTKIKEEFQSEHADQIAAIRSDVDQLHTDLVALRDDLLDNEAAAQRRKKRPGSNLWAHRLRLDEPSRKAVNTVNEKLRQHPLASSAIAGAIICAVSAFAIWSSRHTTSA
jgi:hypothetical protein